MTQVDNFTGGKIKELVGGGKRRMSPFYIEGDKESEPGSSKISQTYRISESL